MASTRLIFGLILALALAGGAARAEPPGRGALLTKPVNWAARAGEAEVAAAYPKGAKDVGFANLGCLLGVGGVLKECRVVGEAPAGAGFGAAALSLAPSFKAHYAPGEEGASVLLPIEFDPPGPKPAIAPINCLAPLCVLQIAPGQPASAQP